MLSLSAGSLSATFGSLTWDSNGSYTYSLNNASSNVSALEHGQSVTDTFSYTVSDAYHNTSVSTLTVTVYGEDKPDASADSASITEGVASTTGNLLTNDSERYNSQLGPTSVLSLSAGSLSATFGSLTWDSNGSYTYSLNNASSNVSALEHGQSVTDTFSYTVSDAYHNTSVSTLTVTVYGEDKPDASADSASITEGVTSTTGNLLSADSENYNNSQFGPTSVLSLSAGSLSATFGSLTWDSNGSYTYSLNNASSNVSALEHGQSVTDTFSYTVSDAYHNTSVSTLTVTVYGEDKPDASADSASITEGVTSTTGNLLSADSENYNNSQFGPTSVLSLSAGSLSATFGSLTWDSNGSYTYSLNNASSNVSALEHGQSVTDTFSYTVSDAYHNTSVSTLTVTVYGEDKPDASADSASITEGVTSTTGNLFSADSENYNRPVWPNVGVITQRRKSKRHLWQLNLGQQRQLHLLAQQCEQ